MLTASIVLYHIDTELVSKAIHSFFAGALGKRKLYLVDNSTNDSLRMLATLYSTQTEYIFTGANLGYGGGHNVAIRAAMQTGADYHIVMNPDISFGPDVIPELCRFMEANPDVGLSVPHMKYPDSEDFNYSCKLLPTPADVFFRRFVPHTSIARKLNDRYTLKCFDYEYAENIPSLSGCFMFLRLDAIRRCGAFDENIFMYFEDIDLSRRIHTQFRTCFYPDAYIVHRANRESYRNIRLMVAHIRSALYYFRKWGWFFDPERKRINADTLERIRNHSKQSL